MTKYNANELPKNIQNIFKNISLWADTAKYEIYAVGGFVRDLIKYNKISDDIDFIVDKKGENNPAITFVNILEKQGVGINKALYENFGTAKLEIEGIKVEFVMPRNEKYNEDSRNPIVEKIDIKQDAIRRDFTINTLMMNIKTGEILDPTGKGIEDLNLEIIRSANPNVSQMIIDDPLRLIRAVRFSAVKGFGISEKLLEEMYKNKDRINIISKERIRVELDKILMADKAEWVWTTKWGMEIMSLIIPEIKNLSNCMESPPWHWDESSYKHTIRVIYNCPKEINIRRAALFHDIGKPISRTVGEDGKAHFYGHEMTSMKLAEDIMRKLTYSNDDIKIVKLLIKNHMKPHLYKSAGVKGSWGDKAVRKYIIELGQWLNSSIQLAYADSEGSAPEDRVKVNIDRMKLFEEHISKVKQGKIIDKPIINGDKLMELFNRPSGKWIKEIIEYQMDLLYENPEMSINDLQNNILLKFKNNT
jgi:putative nucleotidyltransferase with HDIG domain